MEIFVITELGPDGLYHPAGTPAETLAEAQKMAADLTEANVTNPANLSKPYRSYVYVRTTFEKFPFEGQPVLRSPEGKETAFRPSTHIHAVTI